MNFQLRDLLIISCIACYICFLHAGLMHLVPPLFRWEVPWSDNYFFPWSTSVYALGCGHLFHMMYYFGWKYGLFCSLLAISVVCIMELMSLGGGGIIFGEYRFSDTMGTRITPLLPFLVPACWFGLIYPHALLTNIALRGQALRMPSQKYAFQSALVASAMLTYFDVISEPVHVTLGQGVWHHAALVDASTPLATYTATVDWTFAKDQFFQEYFDIPFQNFCGWFLTAFCIYIIMFNVGASRESVAQDDKYNKKLSTDGGSGVWQWLSPNFSGSGNGDPRHLGLRLLVTLPVLIGIVAVMVFYAVHPCHPMTVRLLALVYLCTVSVGISYYPSLASTG